MFKTVHHSVNPTRIASSQGSWDKWYPPHIGSIPTLTSWALNAEEEYNLPWVTSSKQGKSWNFLVGQGFPKDMYFIVFKNIYIECLQRSTKFSTNNNLLKEIRGNTVILRSSDSKERLARLLYIKENMESILNIVNRHKFI